MAVEYSATIGPTCQAQVQPTNPRTNILFSSKLSHLKTWEYIELPVRTFTWNDLSSLLKFAGDIQADNPKDQLTRAQELKEILKQPTFQAETNCFVLENDGIINGYCIVFLEQQIKRAVLAVDISPGLAASSAEVALIRQGMELAKGSGSSVAHICLGNDAPRSGLLASEKFTLARTYLHMLWNHESLPQITLPDGFATRLYTSNDTEKLTLIQNAAFEGSWGFCPNTIEELQYRTAMSNTSYECIVFLEDGISTAAYCWGCIAPFNGNTRGIISMIGVHPLYRGNGLSKPILIEGMRQLRALSVDGISLHVDSNNIPAIKLYESVGFEEIDRLHWYEYKF